MASVFLSYGREDGGTSAFFPTPYDCKAEVAKLQ
jgi:hypothetical protein